MGYEPGKIDDHEYLGCVDYIVMSATLGPRSVGIIKNSLHIQVTQVITTTDVLDRPCSHASEECDRGQ